jgi:hydroxymethylpyrimidine pyrophosphatase-like HAD family hydrolase
MQDAGVYPGMQIRAVVTDLDGTIVGKDGSVSAATVQASRELAKKGIPLIAATARTPNGLAVLRPLMPAITAAVCCNGESGARHGHRQAAVAAHAVRRDRHRHRQS